MSALETLQTTAVQVEELRTGLSRVRGVLEQTESVLTVADDVLGRADDVLNSAADAVQTSRRWMPRVALVVGVVAVVGIAGYVVMRLRGRDDE